LPGTAPIWAREWGEGMHYAELDFFGIYIAPIAPMMVLAWIAMVPLRWAGHRTGVFRHVWHPALFSFALYLIVLAGIVLGVGALR
jgi:hypothetical protein